MRDQTLQFRLITWALAAVLGVLSIWTAAPEMIRPSLPYFLTEEAGSDAASRNTDSASVAAWLGLIRGDLWADYAVALASELPGGIGGAGVGPDAAKAREVWSTAERAATLAPEDARVWTLIAAMEVRLGHATTEVAGPLKMAYYSGPNDVTLMPLRLQIATRLDALADEELQSLVEREIRTIAVRKQNLKPVLVTAYRSASPIAKRFIEGRLNQIDPEFLKSIK